MFRRAPSFDKFYSSVQFTPLYQSVDPMPVLAFKRHQRNITAHKNYALEILKLCMTSPKIENMIQRMSANLAI